MKHFTQNIWGHIAAREVGGLPGSIAHWVDHVLPAETEKMRRDLQVHLLRRESGAGGPGAGAALELLVPSTYWRSLQLLREADVSGRWPRSSSQRKALIDTPQGDSFTMGSMPAGMREPSSNTVFPELLEELRRLEHTLLPNRPPSSTITINRNAQFKPHKDSGAGNGQSRSLIVGLGDYKVKEPCSTVKEPRKTQKSPIAGR